MSDIDGSSQRDAAHAGGLFVRAGLVIPWAEIALRASRSGGPGGQNVNRVATKVEARWDVRASRAIDDAARATLLARLATRIDARGRLRVASQRFRTQGANRKAALERLAALVAGALAPVAPRRPTRRSRASKERRIAEKTRRAAQKRERRRPNQDRADD
jgi:ribosome-associated protein